MMDLIEAGKGVVQGGRTQVVDSMAPANIARQVSKI